MQTNQLKLVAGLLVGGCWPDSAREPRGDQLHCMHVMFSHLVYLQPAKLSSSRPRSNPSKLELSVPEQDSSYSNLGCRTNSQSDLNADKDDGMNSRRPSSVQSSSRARSSKIEDENANWNFIINQGKIIGEQF